MCIVSVVAQGLCLCSVSLNSFVKCGFGHSLVGRAEGGRWQQNASFTFFVLSLLCLPWPLSVQCSQSSTFFKRGLVYKLESSELAWQALIRPRTCSRSLLHSARFASNSHILYMCSRYKSVNRNVMFASRKENFYSAILILAL